MNRGLFWGKMHGVCAGWLFWLLFLDRGSQTGKFKIHASGSPQRSPAPRRGLGAIMIFHTDPTPPNRPCNVPLPFCKKVLLKIHVTSPPPPTPLIKFEGRKRVHRCNLQHFSHTPTSTSFGKFFIILSPSSQDVVHLQKRVLTGGQAPASIG